MYVLTRQQMSDLDQRVIHQYHVPLRDSIERYGKGLVFFVEECFPQATRIVILSGSGNTGGIGLAAAHRFAEVGRGVRVVMTRPELFLKPASKEQYDRLPDDIMVGVSEEASDDELRDLIYGASLIVDALLGYPSAHIPHGEVRRLIAIVNQSKKPVVSLDIPSGLDADEGARHDVVIRADATVSFVLPKRGAALVSAAAYVGGLFALDGGVPDAWFLQEGLERPLYDARGLLAFSDRIE